MSVGQRVLQPDGRFCSDASHIVKPIKTISVTTTRARTFVPAAVVKEFSDLLRAYWISNIRSDRYASAWAGDEWSRNRITCTPSELTKSEIYLAALPLLTSGQARLLDSERMRKQFTALERRTHSGGRESVDDSGAASANDDLCNSAAGALLLALPRPAFELPELGVSQVAAGPRGSYGPGGCELNIGAGFMFP
jgi:hypothetical protein